MKRILFLSAILVALFTNCSKNKYGNTDITSDTYVVGWTFDDPSYKTQISEPLITQDIIDNGAVMVDPIASSCWATEHDVLLKV